LLYNEKENSLRGPWYSTAGCGPGEIIVYKTSNKFNKSTAQSNDYITFEDLKTTLLNNGDITSRKIILSYVYFDSNQTKIKAESKPLLKDLITFLKKQPNVNIRILGHTDNVGDDPYNLKLSILRAEAIVTYIKEQGIQANRFSYEGYGESCPIEKNDTEKGREMNRRIEFEVVK
jgi:outer membrane protein OmpA-like peptidoglycan-associated protein